jgi:hypothetical protein
MSSSTSLSLSATGSRSKTCALSVRLSRFLVHDLSSLVPSSGHTLKLSSSDPPREPAHLPEGSRNLDIGSGIFVDDASAFQSGPQ